jgi:hypothetical protein
VIIHDLPDTAYHARPEIGSTTAKLMLTSPQLFHDRRTGLDVFPDRPAFAIGRAAHAMVLEPDRFDELYTSKGPTNPRTGKPYGRETQAFTDWQEENPGLTVVDPWLYLALERMPQEVCEILSGGASEVSVFQDLPALGYGVKARPDYLRGTEISDLKTIDKIEDCERALHRYSYWFSHAWYRMAMKLETKQEHSMSFIFMEKSAPHRWKIVDLAQEYIVFADRRVDEIMGQIADGIRTGDWCDKSEIRSVAPIPSWLDPDAFTFTDDGISL